MGDQMKLGQERFARMQAIPRAGRVEDIAEAALFLAADTSTFITGVTLPVDGGLTLHRRHEATAAGQLEGVHSAVDKLRG